jgi:hypothetical protein
MPGDEIDLLSIRRGTVTAPAGCGKTHLIAESLTRHEGAKPILILTHTNAGVAALRGRLDRAGVRPSACRLLTIDGWAMWLVSMFPKRAAHDQSLFNLGNPSTDYPNIRVAAARLLKAGHGWQSFAAQTSIVPFAAIAGGRTRFNPGEIAAWRWVAAVISYALMLGGHSHIIGVSPFPA